jgi:catalase
MRFDHERIPERVVHARGAGAFGKFKLLESIEDLTIAPVLTDTTRETPVFVRFSTVLGSRGSADTVRDVRGFATKFYTQEGNWDLVGNDIPVFFIQDAIKFPDVIHAGKPEPHNEVPQAQTAHNNFWDFQFNHTEATHMFMWAVRIRSLFCGSHRVLTRLDERPGHPEIVSHDARLRRQHVHPDQRQGRTALCQVHVDP